MGTPGYNRRIGLKRASTLNGACLQSSGIRTILHCRPCATLASVGSPATHEASTSRSGTGLWGSLLGQALSLARDDPALPCTISTCSDWSPTVAGAKQY